MHKIYLLLGSNEGNCLAQIELAIKEIGQWVGSLKIKSSIYKSEPWGFETENFFFNQVILVETEHSPEVVLDIILNIEEKLGRKRNKIGYESRTIDIDILFYDDLILSSEKLKIPHPMIALRRFTLVPMNEIAPDLIYPDTFLTINETLNQCEDRLGVIKHTEDSKINCKISQSK